MSIGVQVLCPLVRVQIRAVLRVQHLYEYQYNSHVGYMSTPGSGLYKANVLNIVRT